ncbi:MAG: S8 family serine peptidase [Pseudonocardia sp.]|nr:S8 family serine peptidase [Pseudonocardia sp.]
MDQTQLSFVPGEIVRAGTPLTITAPRAMDPQSAQSAMRIRPARGQALRTTVHLDRQGRTAELQTGDLAPGAYVLQIDALHDPAGAPIGGHAEVEFTVGALVGEVPDDHRVEHAVHLAVGEVQVERLRPGARPAEGYLEIVKAVHRESGEAVELAFDGDGKRVDAAEILDAVARRRIERFGAVDESLWRRLDGIGDTDPVDVVVWPRFDPPELHDKPTDAPSTEPPAAEREQAALLRRATRELMRGLAGRGAAPAGVGPDDAEPPVRVTLPAAAVRELAHAEGVGAVFADDRDGILDLADSIAVARSDRAHSLGFTGRDIRVAVFENGPRTTTNLALAGRFDPTPSASNAEDEHARLTHAIVANTQPNRPHGHAPDCRLFSANSTDNDALRWAVRQGCTVISQSFHRGSEPGGAGLQADDILKDHLALRWPYPTICQAAGNYFTGDDDGIDPPRDEFVNHKGYNTLAIGNHNDDATAMSGSSVFRNPSSPHGDRELPELAANGTAVSANGQNKSGTSFAAPAAAGVAALLQDVDPVLRSWPEGCRAILLASAGRNVSGSTWWRDVVSGTDAADGAGAVDAESGVLIAQRRSGRDARPSVRGWDVGTLRSADFGRDRLATFRYRVAVPVNLFVPRVKVALAWNSRIGSIFGLPFSSTLTVDLDLLVRDAQGNQVAASASWDNSYEIVEFAATRGATYDIVIRRWSGTDSTWFGVAWAASGFRLTFPLPHPFPFPDDPVFPESG